MVSKGKKLVIWLFTFCAILLLTLYWQAIAARVCLNIAQLARIQGQDVTDLYLKAYQFAPNDLHVRWRTAEAFARAEQYQRAVDILKVTQVGNVEPYSSLIQASLIENLVKLGRVHEAWNQFSRVSKPIPLDSRAAAHLWLAVLDGKIPKTDVTEVALDRLVRITLGHFLVTHELDPVLMKIKQSNFWQTSEGKHLRSLLEYKAQMCCHHWNYTSSLKEKSAIDIEFISNFLGLSKSEIKIGKERLTNTELEAADYSATRPVQWSENPNRRGFFNTNQGKLRIDAVILEDADYSIYYYRWLALGRKPYVASVKYCTLTSPEYSQEPKVVLAIGKPYALKPTNGKWVNAYVINWNLRERILKPSLILAGRGTLWVDKFSIREISLSESKNFRNGSEKVLFNFTDQKC
ncbi:MAG TPA: hypothetical protein IGP91_09010 [Thermosynechococcus sp. M46_R2017_013]|nr:hypothetical protein [Thermosynechococcus sp. M46_R2017_013]